MKKRDLIILNFLKNRKHGRTRATICKHLNLPRTTVYDSLLRLEQAGKISRHHRKINKFTLNGGNYSAVERHLKYKRLSKINKDYNKLGRKHTIWVSI